MLKRLAEAGLIEHEPYKGVVLTTGRWRYGWRAPLPATKSSATSWPAPFGARWSTRTRDERQRSGRKPGRAGMAARPGHADPGGSLPNCSGGGSVLVAEGAGVCGTR